MILIFTSSSSIYKLDAKIAIFEIRKMAARDNLLQIKLNAKRRQREVQKGLRSDGATCYSRSCHVRRIKKSTVFYDSAFRFQDSEAHFFRSMNRISTSCGYIVSHLTFALKYDRSDTSSILINISKFCELSQTPDTRRTPF